MKNFFFFLEILMPLICLLLTNIHSIDTRGAACQHLNRHRWTGRFEAHLWDKHCLAALHNKKKGRQGVYCISLQNSSTTIVLLYYYILDLIEGEWK